MKIDLNIRPMTLQEKIYAGLQSSQISQQTGFIGVLVGSFDKRSILVGGAKRSKRTEEYHF